MLPVTGPFTRSEIVKGPTQGFGYLPDWLWYQRTWYRQAKPYNLPLSFTYQRGEILSQSGVGAWWAYRNYYSSNLSAPLNASYDTGSCFPEAYNKAYGNFIKQIKPDSASLGIALAQRKQAISMIAARAMSLVGFVRHLRKGRLKMAAIAIGLDSPPPGWRKKGKSFADKFLEGHFGWAPLIGDIGSSINVLQGGVPPCRVRGRSGITRPILFNTATTSDPVYYYTGNDRATWSIGANIAVSNPNLWLANELGFVNPALVAFDAVPFSFVLNWFVNVEQFLASFTDFWGLSVTEPYVTLHWVQHISERMVTKNWPSYGSNTDYLFTNAKSVVTRRFPGSIPGPALKIKAPWVLSPTRGLAAISLLVQRLK